MHRAKRTKTKRAPMAKNIALPLLSFLGVERGLEGRVSFSCLLSCASLYFENITPQFVQTSESCCSNLHVGHFINHTRLKTRQQCQC